MKPSLIDHWTDAWTNGRFRVTAATLGILLPVTLIIFRIFLDTVELRRGATLEDPVLSLFTPVNLTWITFSLIYGGLLSAIFVLLSYPFRLLRMIASYIVLVVIRMACMFVVPLDPPPGTIPLVDPLVEFFGSSTTTLTRDLFFSGHTATLFLLGLGTPVRRWSIVLYGATVMVAVCVLWQHVHYTIDVLVAPLAAFAAFRLSAMILPADEIQ